MAGDSFTVYWARDRVNALKELPSAAAPFSILFGGPHLSQPSFKRAGVKVGDWIYPISVDHGRVQVLGRLCASKIEPEVAPEGIDALKKIDAATGVYIRNLGWPEDVAYRSLRITCTEEIIHGASGSGPFLDLFLEPLDVIKLRFRSRRGVRVPKGIVDGTVKSSLSLQGIYRVALETAILLSRIVEGHQ